MPSQTFVRYLQLESCYILQRKTRPRVPAARIIIGAVSDLNYTDSVQLSKQLSHNDKLQWILSTDRAPTTSVAVASPKGFWRASRICQAAILTVWRAFAIIRPIDRSVVKLTNNDPLISPSDERDESDR